MAMLKHGADHNEDRAIIMSITYSRKNIEYWKCLNSVLMNFKIVSAN